MKPKIVVLLLMVLVTSVGVYAKTLAEIWQSNEVMACRYMDKITLLDLNSGEEAELNSSQGVLSIIFNKSGQKLFYLVSESEPGLRYEDPSTDYLVLFEINLPNPQPTKLVRFKVAPDFEEESYSYAKIVLNKDANVSIIVTYGMSYPEHCLKYEYNVSTKKLSAGQKYIFKPLEDVYKFKNTLLISAKSGKYYNLKEDRYYNLYTKDEAGYDWQLTDLAELLKGDHAKDEPLLYCVSPDSSRILFSYASEDSGTMGGTFCINTEGEKLITLSETDWMGDEFVPYWTKDKRLVYLHQGATSYDDEHPSINFVDTNCELSVLKSWDDYWVGPMEVVYRP